MNSPITTVTAATTLVVLNKTSKGEPTITPIVAGFCVALALGIIGKTAPGVAGAFGNIILITACLEAGGELATKITTERTP